MSGFVQSVDGLAGGKPSLIAIGQAVNHHRPPRWPVRLVRRLAVGRSLRVLAAIQPGNGGFLEATPLTSFVALGLASTGKADHPVVRKCVEFIGSSVRLHFADHSETM